MQGEQRPTDEQPVIADIIHPVPITHLPPRRSTATLVCWSIGLATLCIAALAAIVIGLGALFYYTSEEEPVSPQERELVVQAGELAPLLEGVEVDPAAESIVKTRYFDGSFDIDYEYTHPGEQPLYVQSSVHFEPSVSDARTTYRALGVGLTMGLSLSGEEIEQAERNDLLKWGDESRCAILTAQGQPVGNFFVARQDRRVFHVLISGHVIEDPQALRELVEPHLKRLESYQPAE